MEKEGEVSISRDWKDRLSVSRDLGTGFAAPGGEFTRALYEWSLTPGGSFLQKILEKRRVVELGAGMMPYGYALAATCGAKNFVAVEPFYADKQRASVKAIIEEQGSLLERIPYKVEGRDMLDYLKDEADELLCVVACGIEDCILPSTEYRKQVEGEIYRVLRLRKMLRTECFMIKNSYFTVAPVDSMVTVPPLGTAIGAMSRPSTIGLLVVRPSGM